MLINIRKLLTYFSLSLFPKKCIGCKATDFWICPKCVTQIPLSGNNPFSWSSSVFMYHHPTMRRAIWLLKFSKKYSVLNDIEIYAQKHFQFFLQKHNLQNRRVILVPIPITKRSKAKRGYNQSTYICKFLAKRNNNIEIREHMLEKTLNHISQNKIKHRGLRAKNVKDSFRAHNIESLQEIPIILVDDVITTGATISEARKALIQKGIKDVYAFSLAH